MKAESSALGNNLREYEALAKEVKVLRQAVDTRYATLCSVLLLLWSSACLSSLIIVAAALDVW